MLKPVIYEAPDFNSDQFRNAPAAVFIPAPADKLPPQGYAKTDVHPFYVNTEGYWHLVHKLRMDCPIVYYPNAEDPDDRLLALEQRKIQEGDLVLIGRRKNGEQGIYVHENGFVELGKSAHAHGFRTIKSKESPLSYSYRRINELLDEHSAYGNILWVSGPNITYDDDCISCFEEMIKGGKVHGFMAGNAVAVHDLESAVRHTALGSSTFDQAHEVEGDYNHLDIIRDVTEAGSIEAYVRKFQIDAGIIGPLVNGNIPFTLAGSIRDDGPLPGVISDVYVAQDIMRTYVQKATLIFAIASQLHSIATSNLAPSFYVENGTVKPLYFIEIDIDEGALTRLDNRGGVTVETICDSVHGFFSGLYMARNRPLPKRSPINSARNI